MDPVAAMHVILMTLGKLAEEVEHASDETLSDFVKAGIDMQHVSGEATELVADAMPVIAMLAWAKFQPKSAATLLEALFPTEEQQTVAATRVATAMFLATEEVKAAYNAADAIFGGKSPDPTVPEVRADDEQPQGGRS